MGKEWPDTLVASARGGQQLRLIPDCLKHVENHGTYIYIYIYIYMFLELPLLTII